MTSKIDIEISLLVLIAGIVMYGVSPGELLFVSSVHTISMFIAGLLAIVFGAFGLMRASYCCWYTRGVSIVAIIIGIVYILTAPGLPLEAMALAGAPHMTAMKMTAGITIIAGIFGIIAGLGIKPKSS